MRLRCIPVLLCSALLWCADQLPAQGQKILSPRDSVFLSFDTSVVTVNYSRPSMRGRRILGELVPWDRVWRTGANQATHLRTTLDITMGGVPVPRGTYTLWSLPSRTGWKIILNKQTGQWGTQYDERQDLARFDASVATLPVAVETLTVSLEATGKSSGILKLVWEQTAVTVPFERTVRSHPLSPLDSTRAKLNGQNIAIRYCRPFMRGRTIWGVVVPMDSVWRTGANLATTLETGVDLKIGTAIVPKGAYTLYSIPSDAGMTLIISRKPGGTPPEYDPALDLVRLPLKLQKSKNMIDPFTISLVNSGSRQVTLKIAWADRTYSTTMAARK
jgi:hypothetical protein